jgi:hypothetical protein
MADRNLREKAREEERNSIREKIDQFYGPFLILRGKSKRLYEGLFLPKRTEEEQRTFAGVDGTYRTVLALVRGHKFGESDKALLEQMTAIDQETSTLIQTKMGLVDEEELRRVLADATVHFWVMKVLMEGRFVGEDQFGNFVFPRDLDDKIEAKLQGLNERLATLQE